MRRWFAVLAVVALTAPSTVTFAWGAPMDGALRGQLLGVYYEFNRDLAAGHLDEALALRSSTAREELTRQLKTPKDRADYLAGASEAVPARVEPRHASLNSTGDKALLVVLAGKGTASNQARSELDLGFVKEGGAWKLDDLAVGPGPAEIRRCTDPSNEAVTAYDASRRVSLIGRIERVDFQPGYTVVMVLAGNAETCAFLPPRAVLRQRGLDPATFQPYRIAEIVGAANRSNAQKVMVDNITVHEEQ
jgi:hypothetical protein